MKANAVALLILAFGAPAQDIKPSQEWSSGCRHRETHRIKERKFQRITTAEAWEKFWAALEGEKAGVPAVDFKKDMVVACTFGKCGTFSVHDDKFDFDSAELKEKEGLKIILRVETTSFEYACSDRHPYWVAVLPARPEKIRLVARVPEHKGMKSEEQEFGEIP